MAAKTASLSVNIIADAAKAKAGLKDAEGAFQKFKREVGATNGVMGVFDKQLNSAFGTLKQNALGFSAAAGAALVAFGASSVKAASNLKESINAVQVTFGAASSSILEFSKGAAQAVGMSQSQFNMFAVQFAGFAQRVGKSSTEVTQIIKELANRTADFASVMNLDVSEAARVFQSALAGETEPIKKFGIDMSAAAIETYALANGLVRTKAEITESIKQTARYGLLMQETSKVTGDFKNTQDSLANSSRTLKARFEDLQATLGEKLIPFIEELAGRALDVVDILQQVGPAIRKVADAASYGSIGFEVFGISMGDVVKNLVKFGTNPFVAVLSGLQLLDGDSKKAKVAVEELRVVYQNFPGAASGVEGSLDGINGALGEQKTEVDLVTEGWERYKDKLNLASEFLDLKEQIQTFRTETETAFLAGKISADEYFQGLIGVQEALVNFAILTGTIRTQIAQNVFTFVVDTWQLERALFLLQSLQAGTIGIAGTGALTSFVSPYGAMPVGRILPGFELTASGGIFNGAQTRIIGEAGPEAVIPLTRPNRAMQLMEESGLADMAVGMSPMPMISSGSTVININAGSVVTENDLIESIRKGLANSQRNGSRLVYSNT